MAFADPEFITPLDLYIAYRKAKKEAFEDTNCAHGLKFAIYEESLEKNLRELRRRLIATKTTWNSELEFLGVPTCIPKSISVPNSDSPVHFESCDPLQTWRHKRSQKKSFREEFRVVIDATVEFLVISALWLIKVGHKFDAILDTRHAVGGRLRRWRPKVHESPGTVGELNLDSHSLFHPYYGAYARWRGRGLKAMRRELENDGSIVALTMDLKQFYHRIDASFLLEPEYLKLTRITLTEDERRFTGALIKAIDTWNTSASAAFGVKRNGVPVGLTASGVIANALLKQFDDLVCRELLPVYYARYVDDVFLVLRQGHTFNSGEDVLQWLAERLGVVVKYESSTSSDEGPSLRLLLPYAANSALTFVGAKQKIFQLQGQHGLDLLSPIEEQIRRQSSEHRALPDVPDREAAMADRALLVTSDATLLADALRKADVITLRRAGFALLLRDIEAHARDLEPRAWEPLRKQFYGLAERHLVTPQGFFDYQRYFPRVFGLMIACNDLEAAKRFVARLTQVVTEVYAICSDEMRGQMRSCCRTLSGRMFESTLQALHSRTPLQSLVRLLGQLRDALQISGTPPSATKLLRLRQQLILADWSRLPYAKYWLNGNAPKLNAPAVPKNAKVRRWLPLEGIKAFESEAKLQPSYWPALAFPTRPISFVEITTRAPQLIEDYSQLRSVTRALRGSWMPEQSNLRVEKEGKYSPMRVIIPTGGSGAPIVALTNLHTSDSEWRAAVDDTPQLSLERYRRLNQMINVVIRQRLDSELNSRPRYVILPECSVPQRWAIPLAVKLTTNRISLIAGLEYRRTAKGLHNEALLALTSNFAGYPASLCLLQSKQAPAWGEQSHILEQVGLPVVAGDKPPVYVHGGFCFGVLICSDLTDINSRSRFQGHVDCIFVPEWNSDVDTFASLVESASLDVHAFIVQANNLRFGDSRIRAPYKVAHRRDAVRLKGGMHGYVVFGEIDYRPLREFQSHVTPPLGDNETFKPFPIGFEIAEHRRTDRSRS